MKSRDAVPLFLWEGLKCGLLSFTLALILTKHTVSAETLLYFFTFMLLLGFSTTQLISFTFNRESDRNKSVAEEILEHISKVTRDRRHVSEGSSVYYPTDDEGVLHLTVDEFCVFASITEEQGENEYRVLRVPVTACFKDKELAMLTYGVEKALKREVSEYQTELEENIDEKDQEI